MDIDGIIHRTGGGGEQNDSYGNRMTLHGNVSLLVDSI